MAESRLSTLRALWASKIVKWLVSAWALVASYDGVSSQFALPKLGNVVGMSGSLLPWWGWLLALQGIFVYGLFEYVRRLQFPAVPPEPLSERGVPMVVDRFLVDVTDRIRRLETDTMRLEPLARQVAEYQATHRAVIDDYQNMSGLEARFGDLLDELKLAIQKENESLRMGQRVVENKANEANALAETVEVIRVEGELNRRDLEKLKSRQEDNRERCLGSSYAIGSRERLANLKTEIFQYASALYNRLKAGQVYSLEEWIDWECVHAQWENTLDQWLSHATWYAVSVKERTLTVDDRKYGLPWSVSDGQFPNMEANRRFKRFRIIQQQWEELLPNVQSGLDTVAFSGLTASEARSGRPAG